MEERPKLGLEIRALLLGVAIGFGTNLVTSNPSEWPSWIRPIDTYSPFWLSFLILTVIGTKVGGWALRKKRHPWPARKNPYPGLNSYGEDRQGVYFGREQDIRELAFRLRTAGRTPQSRFIPVIGSSGVGKSSLVRAGLIPAVPGSTEVVLLSFSGPSPFSDLAAALLQNDDHERIAAAAKQLRREAQQLAINSPFRQTHGQPRADHLLSLLTVARERKRWLLLIVDQIEDLAPQRHEDADLFIGSLSYAIQNDAHVVVVATLRREFVGIFERRAPQLFTRPYALGPLADDQLRRVIVEPFHAAGRELARGLADEIAADAAGPDALPLLAAVLARLYDTHESGVLTSADYQAVGRVSGVVDAQANAAVLRLQPEHPIVDILNTLITFVEWREEIGRLNRRRVHRSELTAEQLLIVDEFVDVRLIVKHNETFFEIAHDAVLRAWTPLRDFLDEQEPRLQRLAEITSAAHLWERQDSARKHEYLLPTNRLHDARLTCEGIPLPALVKDFIDASDAEKTRSSTSMADEVAWHAQQVNDEVLARTLAQAAVIEHHPTPYAKLTLALYAPILRHRLGSLPSMGTAYRFPTSSISWSPDCQLAVLRSNDVLLFDHPADSNPRSLKSPHWQNNKVSWNGDRLTAPASTPRHRAILEWSPFDEIAKVVWIPRYPTRFGFSRLRNGDFAWGNNQLAEPGTLGWLGLGISVIRVWKPGMRPHLLKFPDSLNTQVRQLAWSPTGDLAEGGKNVIRVWANGRDLSHDITIEGAVSALDWSYDGRLVAAVEGAVMIWSSITDDNPLRVSDFKGSVDSVRWSSLGHLAVVAEDRLHVWGPEQLSKQKPRPVTLQLSRPIAIGWSPRGHLAAAVMTTEFATPELRVWDLGIDPHTLLRSVGNDSVLALTVDQRHRYGLPQIR